MEPAELHIHTRLGLVFGSSSSTKSGLKKYYGGNDAEVRKQILPAHRMLPWSWLLLFLSIVWLGASFLLDLIDFKSGYFFFQRSGAILVISSLWVEWLTSRTPLDGRMTMSLDLVPTTRYAYIRSLFAKIGLYTAVFGTLVWAYGDTPFIDCSF